MNDSHDIDMPYHPGCKHRYMEHLDHNALIKHLNEIADEIYNLTQLCGDLETRLSDHNTDTEAHRYLRELINASTNRLATVKETIDNSLSILENKVDSNYSTLTAADGQLATRLDNVDTEIANIRTTIESTTLDLQDSITSTVNGNKPIIKSITADNSVILAELPSEHGKFRYGTDETKTVVTYTADNNSTGIPNHTATLLDENGNTSFPGIVTAPTLRGNADTATLATKATKLNTAITIAIKDASGENLGSSVTTNLSGNITLKVPSVLKNTDITGIANKAHNDATGADIVDTYVHKTSINEEIDGIKTFNDVLKGSTIEPKVHTGSSVGNSTVPYENVYATNITSTNASIDNITGTLTGNASTATKLATARKINGTDFDGTTAITTSSWGSARNISIGDASNTNTGAAVSVNGSANITLKLPSTIKGTLTGNASTATKLAVSKKINNTAFDGSSDITTAIWGTARDVSITDNTGEHVGTKVSVNGSANITLKLPSSITATNFYGVASSATKLNNAVTINGTTFDGTANITTAAWGYSRNIQITDSDSSNSGAITAVNGTNNVTLKLPGTIKAALTGNASTATKLATARKINNTSFDGTANITTAQWGTARNITISDASSTNTGTSTSVNGSSDITLKLPSTIKGTLTGNADTATQFSANTTVALTGDATGTSAGSKKGWSIPVTLANTGVTAGIYGHNTTNTNIQANTGSFMVPIISVDSKGRITNIQDNPCTIKTPVYTAGSGITLSSSNAFSLTTIYSGDTVLKTVVGGRFSSSKLYLSTRNITINTHGRITANTAGTDITIDLSSLDGISVGTAKTLYYHTEQGSYVNGEIVPGSALYSTFNRSGYMNLSGQQTGTWITSGTATLEQTITHNSNSSGEAYGVTYIYKQSFRKLSI